MISRSTWVLFKTDFQTDLFKHEALAELFFKLCLAYVSVKTGC